MNWQAVATVAMATVGIVVPQYLTDINNPMGYSINLSRINDFSFDLFRQLSGKGAADNFFFSPYSIWTALTLAYFGAAGDTQKQLKAALRATDETSTLTLWRALENMYTQRAKNQSQYTLRLANHAYFDQSLHLRPDIFTTLQNDLQIIDFTDLQVSSSNINQFVSTTTRGTIKSLVSPDDMVQAVMMLINGAYFKGTWKYQFDPSSTNPKQFFVSPRNAVDVLMMETKTKLKLAQSQELDAQVLELPYAGETISMLLFLPNTEGQEGLSNMVSALTSDTLLGVTGGSAETVMVDLLLPKFKMEQMLKDDLKKGLKNLGIRDMFNDTLADLSKFAVNEQLVVTSTIHKAFVEVNEEGTEAAAVTKVNSYARSLDGSEQSFHCNRPFVFIIHDNETKNVLFIGVYKKPQT